MPNIIVTLKKESNARELVSRPGGGISATGTKVLSKRVLVIPMFSVTDDYLTMLQNIPEVEGIDLALKDQDDPKPDWEYMFLLHKRITIDVATLGRLIDTCKPEEK